ncbi:MAG: DUF5107 domain-containing protein [Lentisphaerae bacterium]|nr:DUF5107 domain-containing protein [Lentisphaerota bacterium]
MKTDLRVGKLSLPGLKIGQESALPPLRCTLSKNIRTDLSEDDGLFIGYGLEVTALPHRMLEDFDGQSTELQFDCVTLENDFLKAVFLPQVGGRLWSLYDKIAGRNLVHANPVFKPGNLAICCAWPAGGVEWNVGSRGHDAYTCRPLFTARTQDKDGTPVLRFYEFCRKRAVYYQMDFFLPAQSQFLYARMRLYNPNDRVEPMYWWSNIAVEQKKGMRIVVPATTTFTNTYVSELQHSLQKLPLPMASGEFDCTYPENYPTSKDQFFNIAAGERKFEAALYADGYGLVHTSTDRLQGRKLFVWGHGPGGERWQRFLTSPEGADYLEIQAGLGKTQMECLPMPPKAAWEWLEAYGPLQVQPEQLHGPWPGAVSAVASALEQKLPRQNLAETLQRTKTDIALKKGTVLFSGSGWGALDLLLRSSNPAPHLDFGSTGEQQEPWVQLLQTGRFPTLDGNSVPHSYLVQEEWFELLRKAVKGVEAGNWYALFQLGVNYFARSDFERAEQYFTASLQLQPNPWCLYALGNVRRCLGDLSEATAYLEQALRLRPGDASLARETLKAFKENNDCPGLERCYALLDPSLHQVPMLQFLHAHALANLGSLDEAESILLQDGGLQIPDLREGECSLSELYVYIQCEKARRTGRVLEPAAVQIPPVLDFRMNKRRSK